MAQSHSYSSAWWQLLDTVALSDTVDLPRPVRWLLILATWDVKFNALSSWADWTTTSYTMTGATVWTVIPSLITRVWSTWTNATVAALV